MKTKLMIVAFMLAVSAGLAKAADPIGPKVVVVSQKESGVFKVIYQGEKPGKVHFTIYDAEGAPVFHETISGVNGFVRPVNFKGMAPGEYTIEIGDASGKQLHKVTYEVEKPVVNVHVAKIGNDEKYLLAVANRGGEEQVLVKIYDGTNHLVHQETITVKENFGLVYNLKYITGSPVFEITDVKGNRIVKH